MQGCVPEAELPLGAASWLQWPHDMRTMLGWAFEPAPEPLLLDLIAKGERVKRAGAVLQLMAVVRHSTAAVSDGR